MVLGFYHTVLVIIFYVTLSKWVYLPTCLKMQQHFKIINLIWNKKLFIYCNWFNIYLPCWLKTKSKRRIVPNIIFHIFQISVNASVSLNSTEENWFWTALCVSIGYLKNISWHRYLVIEIGNHLTCALFSRFVFFYIFSLCWMINLPLN
jgi:hypothetical protein